MKQYTPHDYWEQRLQNRFDLTGVGHAGLGPYYNALLYERRKEKLFTACSKTGLSLPGSSVFEVGCGTGFYTQLFSQNQVQKYVGLDITSISIDSLKMRFPDFQFICADISAFDTSAERSSFDVVFAADVLFHIVDERKFEQAIQNMSDLLRVGGVLIISDIFPRKTVQIAPHVRLRSMQRYQDLLLRCSLDVICVEPIFVLLHPSPPIDNNALQKAMQMFWRIAFRYSRSVIVDRGLSGFLAWVDRYLLPNYSHVLPNTHWLFAQKRIHDKIA